MPTLALAGLYGVAIFAIGLLITTSIRRKRDPLQPKAVPSIIPLPFIGHLLGILLDRNHYYTKISQRWNLPIIALPMFGGNVYVVKSPDLVYSIQRQPRSLSFWYFESDVSGKFSGMSKKSAESLFHGIKPDETGPSITIDSLRDTRVAMSPQGGMHEMIRTSTTVIKESLDKLQQGGRLTVDMYTWIQHEVTMATTEAVYGPTNPYREPKVQEAFWGFSDSTMMLMLPGILPRLLASKGVAGRETLKTAFEQYFGSGCPRTGSELIKSRYACQKGKITDEEIARAECVDGLAILTNSSPATFWTLFHMYSNPSVLEDVRNQVEAIATSEPATSGHGEKRSIGLDRLKDAPILFSLIQETLRYRARGTGPRMAMEDVVISDDQRDYHIEKGSVVMIAHNAMHLDKEVWGDTADQFIADRFLPGKKVPSNAFRGFGGGANMCPGKGYALAEIAALVAMLAMRFDLKPVDSKWSEPGQDLSNMARENPPPLRKVMVEISPRPGLEKIEWAFDE